MGINIVCSKFPAIIIINDVEQPLRMKGSPTDEKGKDNGSYKQKEKLALFDSCAGITALICQVWNGLVGHRVCKIPETRPDPSFSSLLIYMAREI